MRWLRCSLSLCVTLSVVSIFKPKTKRIWLWTAANLPLEKQVKTPSSELGSTLKNNKEQRCRNTIFTYFYFHDSPLAFFLHYYFFFYIRTDCYTQILKQGQRGWGEGDENHTKWCLLKHNKIYVYKIVWVVPLWRHQPLPQFFFLFLFLNRLIKIQSFKWTLFFFFLLCFFFIFLSRLQN